MGALKLAAVRASQVQLGRCCIWQGKKGSMLGIGNFLQGKKGSMHGRPVQAGLANCTWVH